MGSDDGDGESRLGDFESMVQKSGKSITQAVKKVAVELFTEKRDLDHLELIMNNALALALNSRSSECVQVSWRLVGWLVGGGQMVVPSAWGWGLGCTRSMCGERPTTTVVILKSRTAVLLVCGQVGFTRWEM